MQLSIENGYQRFITLVANARALGYLVDFLRRALTGVSHQGDKALIAVLNTQLHPGKMPKPTVLSTASAISTTRWPRPPSWRS
jgi:hypothetical protein